MKNCTKLIITFIVLAVISVFVFYRYFESQTTIQNKEIDERLSEALDYHFVSSQVFDSPLQVEEYNENIIFKGLDESILMYDGENIEVLFKLDNLDQIRMINDFSLKNGILYVRHSEDRLVVIDVESKRLMKKAYNAQEPLACTSVQLLYDVTQDYSVYTNVSQSLLSREEECYKLEVSVGETNYTPIESYFKYQELDSNVAIIKGSKSFSVVPNTTLYYNDQIIDENVIEFSLNSELLYYLVVEPFLLEVKDNSTYVPIYYLMKYDLNTQKKERVVEKPVLFYSLNGDDLIYSLTGLDEQNQGIYLQASSGSLTKIYDGLGRLFQSTQFGVLAIISDKEKTHLGLYGEGEWTLLQTIELQPVFTLYTTIR